MFHAKVKGRVFQILGIDYITSGSVGLQIDFEFDDEWTGLEKYATFEAGSESISLELENDACVIPWEVLEDPNVNLRIGVRGSNGDNVIIPTIWREYEIHEGTKFSEDSGSPASTTIIEQLSARMDALEENGGVDIFWATYGLSSYDEIYEQFNTHNRLVACVYNDHVYFMQKEINSSTAYKFFAPDFTTFQSRVYWLKVDDSDQWTNGYEEVTSGGGDTPEITWVTYGTTTYSEVKTAYDADKQVLCKYGNITYQLNFWMDLNGPFFTFTAPVYDSRESVQSIYWLKVNSSGWSNGSISIPTAATTEIMWATYGTTSYSDIAAAVAAEKAVLCVYNAHVYYLTGCSSNPSAPIAEFAGKIGVDSDNFDAWLKCNNTTWTNGTKCVTPTEVTVSTAGNVSRALDAGKLYHFTGALTSLTLTLTAADSGNVAQYHFDFDSGSTAPTVTVTGVTWPNGSFTPEASKHYEIDILNGYGLIASW